jgi:hypothetical protein
MTSNFLSPHLFNPISGFDREHELQKIPLKSPPKKSPQLSFNYFLNGKGKTDFHLKNSTIITDQFCLLQAKVQDFVNLKS